MSKGTLWSEEEIEILTENYLKLSKVDIMSLLPNRTYKAIRSKANTLNLKKINDYEKVENPYKREDGIIMKMCKCCRRYLPLELKYYPKDSVCNDGFRNICKECKGENFEVSKAIDWTDEEINILNKYYSTSTNEHLIERYFPYRDSKSIIDKASKLGLSKEKYIITQIRILSCTEETKNKIALARKREGAFQGKNNPMYNSKRYGKLNPNWKGGISPYKSEVMRSEEYKIWRDNVFKRDNYTCQCCGRQTHDNEAHHLDNFADFEDKRFDINNGITLCKQCHNPNQKGSYHNECGTLHNTKEDFEEWLNNKRTKELVS